MFQSLMLYRKGIDGWIGGKLPSYFIMRAILLIQIMKTYLHLNFYRIIMVHDFLYFAVSCVGNFLIGHAIEPIRLVMLLAVNV